MMRTLVLSFALLAAALPASATLAIAGDTDVARLALSISKAKGGAQGGKVTAGDIVVQGSSGIYDRVATNELRLSLTLGAELSAAGEGYKVIKSQLALKAEGAAGAMAPVDALGGPVPVASIATTDSFALGFAPQGGIAQNAIAVCNALSTADRSAKTSVTRAMSVAVDWRVTTGRFSFK